MNSWKRARIREAVRMWYSDFGENLSSCVNGMMSCRNLWHRILRNMGIV